MSKAARNRMAPAPFRSPRGSIWVRVDYRRRRAAPHRLGCPALAAASPREPVWRDPMARLFSRPDDPAVERDIDAAAARYEWAARAYQRNPPPRGRTHWRGPYVSLYQVAQLADHVQMPIRPCPRCGAGST